MRRALIFTGILAGALSSEISPAILVVIASIAGYFYAGVSGERGRDKK